MNKTIYGWVWGMIMVAGLSGAAAARADKAPAVDRDQDFMVYKLKEGDTLKDLAETYLGGKEYILELLEYNQIASPGTVTAGATIVIPLKIRRDAFGALREAEQQMAAALDARAEDFAPEEYNQALGVFESARTARTQAAYDKAIALSRLASLKAQSAREAADLKAVVGENARLTFVRGEVALSFDEGTIWKAAAQGDEVPLNAHLRAGKDSRCEVTLADGSVFQLMGSSHMALKEFKLDRRTGRRSSKLRVLLGNILGNIKPKPTDDSRFEVDTGGASIAIRGTTVRVGTDEDETTRLSVLEGETALSANNESVGVPGGFGSYVEKGRPPAKPVKLPPPPEPRSPPAADFTTARQQLEFTWDPGPGDRPESYHLEIAADPAFNALVEEQVVKTAGLTSGVLSEGRYHWRVASLDRRGLEGPFSETRTFVVQKEMAIAMLSHTRLAKINDRNVVGGANRFTVRPKSETNSVVRVQYRLDDEDFVDFVEDIHVDADGQHRLTVRGMAADGTVGQEKFLEFYVDATPPLVNLQVLEYADETSGEKRAWIRFETSDDSGVEAVQAQVNGGAWSAVEEKLGISLVRDVEVRYRAMDTVGNQTPVRAVRFEAAPGPGR